MSTETRRFTMHPKLLFDVIQRQAGTLSKAILEGVMNAADASASAVHVTVTEHEVTIADDGHGFRSRAEVESFFEVFGQPHDVSEGKVYGTFRMGRGQLFSFGCNTWRTGAFQMEVDIKNRGLDYDLSQTAEPAPGCRVHVLLYDALIPSALAETQRDLELWCKYAPLTVTFNGTTITKDRTAVKWTEETDDALIRVDRTSRISVYNLGIHVTDIPAHRYGCGGVVISKQQLRVNFARNDVQSDCPVWRRIAPVLRRYGDIETERPKRLNDAGRQRLVDRILQGEMDSRATMSLKVVTAVTGRHYPLAQLFVKKRFTVAPKGDRIGGRLMDQDLAFVVAEDTLDRFHADSPEAFVQILHDLRGPYQDVAPYEPYEVLCKGFDTRHIVLDDQELTPTLRAWQDIVQRSLCQLVPRGHNRRILIGESETANAWTDGTTYITLNRDYLARRSVNAQGLTDVGLLLVHELSHTDPDFDGCDHDPEFYETFYRLARLDGKYQGVGSFVERALAVAPECLRKQKLRVQKTLLLIQDREAEAQRLESEVAKAAQG